MKLSDDFRTVVIITEKSMQYKSRQSLSESNVQYYTLQLVEKVLLIPLKRSERKGLIVEDIRSDTHSQPIILVFVQSYFMNYIITRVHFSLMRG